MELKKDSGRLGLQMVASQKVIMLMEKKMQPGPVGGILIEQENASSVISTPISILFGSMTFIIASGIDCHW